MYEANPMAFIVEQAGGRAETGAGPVLDVEPEALHDRTPLFIGSPSMVEDALAFLSGERTSGGLDREGGGGPEPTAPLLTTTPPCGSACREHVCPGRGLRRYVLSSSS